MKSYLIVLLLFLFVFSCSDGPSKTEFEKLKSENEALKAELEDCKYGAAKLYESANQYFKNNDFKSAKDAVDKLIQKHPSSQEATLSKSLLEKINLEIKRIENEQRLTEEKAKREKELEVARATKNMFKKYNEFTETYWYQDASSPRYVNRNGFFLEFGRSKSGSLTDLYLNIQYYAEDWLFVEYMSFTIDDSPYKYFPSKVERDNDGGKIWEWTRTSLTQDTYSIVSAIINSKTAKIRFNGSQYYDDRVITSTEKKALKNVLLAYEALGGKINFESF
ncbi:MAG: hypothetical protein IH618_02395 [Ignavibacteriaceae bacterium]|nr:hypothetical protein [Ignavibacteriaceae bacterium]